ncbi:MAG: RHS repeat protein, partial [Ardenticatenales bacterium]|nr:RHS repeat protein [Ardenticatenales bacterium]
TEVFGASYDARGQLLSVTDALERTTQFEYDARGQQTRRIDPAGIVTAYEYDPAGRLVAVVENYRPAFAATHEVNVRTAYQYDAAGNLRVVLDPAGQTARRIAYDALYRPISVTDALSNTQHYQYTPRGELAQVTDARGQAMSYQYDAVGSLVRITRPDETVELVRDALGQLVTMTDTLGTTSFTYDALGQLSSVTDPFGQVLGYDYDAAGRQTSLIYPGSRTVQYDYDARGRLTDVTAWDTQLTEYGYDTAGQLATIERPNGVTSHYDYDAAGQLLSLQHAQGGATLASFAYQYDPAGNRTEAIEAQGNLTTTLGYTYDPLYRLTGVTSSNGNFYEYTYDVRGNRTTQTDASGTMNYSYDLANRLTSVAGQAYSYDANGHLLDDGTYAYQYDSAGRMRVVASDTTTETLSYNGLGAQLAQSEDGTSTTFLVDLNRALPQVLSDGSADYLYGLARLGTERGDGWQYEMNDALGSVRAQTDASGAVTALASYDPFGVPLPGSDLGRFGYTGAQQDPAGLLYLRARHYRPETGRFLQTDPFPGLAGMPSTLHPYFYGLNNPVRYTDPSGETPLHGAIIGGTVAGVGDLGFQVLENHQAGIRGNAMFTHGQDGGRTARAVAAGAYGGAVGYYLGPLGFLGSTFVGALGGAAIDGTLYILDNEFNRRRWTDQGLADAVLRGALWGGLDGCIGGALEAWGTRRLRNRRIWNAESGIRGERFEWAVGFDRYGNELFRTTSYHPTAVDFHPDDIAIMASIKAKRGEVHVTHNHPDETSLDFPDMDQAIKYLIDGMGVVTPQHRYSLEIPPGKHRPDYKAAIVHNMQNVKLNTAVSGDPRWDQMWKLGAQKDLGWKYRQRE